MTVGVEREGEAKEEVEGEMAVEAWEVVEKEEEDSVRIP